jgi:hypothetical protein
MADCEMSDLKGQLMKQTEKCTNSEFVYESISSSYGSEMSELA